MTRILLLLILLPVACIKKDGKIPATNSLGGTTGTPSTGIGDGSDPLAFQAWHLKNTGQNSFSTNTGYGSSVVGEDLDVDGVFALGISGRGVRIAVSDSGVEVEHPDLKANELVGEHRNYAFADSSYWRGADPYPAFSQDGHGTSVTGLAAARGWNNIGSRGVAPHASFAGFQFVIDYGSETDASILARGIDQTDGDFDIFNYSYGFQQCYYRLIDPILNEAIEAGVQGLRNGKGALYVQSAGNAYAGLLSQCLGVAISGNPIYLGNTNFTSNLTSPHKIIVGATNAAAKRSSYSTPGSGIWVSAPGGEFGTSSPAMVTTDLSTCNDGYSLNDATLNNFNRGFDNLNLGCNYTSYMNGTSSAAPVTTGTIALMLQANPNLTWRDVKHILMETAEIIDNLLFPEVLGHPFDTLPVGYEYDYRWLRNATGKYFSNYYGFGRINALAAVLMAKNYNVNLGTYVETKQPRNDSWYYSSGTLALEIPDNSAVGVSNSIDVLHNLIVESVQVQINTDHPNPSDLAVHLISPSGFQSRMLLMNSGAYALAMPADKDLLTNFFYGEESRGIWTIRVYDGKSAEVGNLTGWKIKINGHKVTSDGIKPDPVSALTMQATYSSGRTSPLASFTGVTGAARYEVSVGSTAGASDIVGWESIGGATSHQIRNMSLQTGVFYYLNIRAVDDQEDISAVRTAMWKTTF